MSLAPLARVGSSAAPSGAVLAILRSGRYRPLLGWLALAIGVGSAIMGCYQLVRGATSLVFHRGFPLGTYLSAGWLIWLGIEVWRGSDRAAAPEPGQKV